MFFEINEIERLIPKFDNCFLANEIPYTGYNNKTYKWFTTDITSRNFNTPHNEEISYQFNEFGYRSSNFNDKRKIKVMTVGCSFAFGNGIPAKRRFSYVFCNLLGKQVCDWNLSWPGTSGDYTARIVSSCVPILKPDILLINFPHMSRREFFDAEGEVFSHRIQRKTHNLKDAKLHKSHLSLVSLYQDMYRFLMNYRLIEATAHIHNIKWLYSIQKDDLDLYEKIRPLVNDTNLVNPLNKIDTGRDGGHPGSESHKNHARNYFNTYEDKYV